MNIGEFNKKDILGDFEYELNKLCRSCIGTATEIKIKQQPLINLFEEIVWFFEKEKEKNKELEEKIIHRYKRICPECNNSFIAKRNNTKYCQKCSKKVACRKYKEANKEKIREYSKLHMREYRAKKKLLKEE